MTFALVAYLIIGGQLHAFVLDDGLTIADCNRAVASRPVHTLDNDGRPVDLRGAALVCEVEA